MISGLDTGLDNLMEGQIFALSQMLYDLDAGPYTLHKPESIGGIGTSGGILT